MEGNIETPVSEKQRISKSMPADTRMLAKVGKVLREELGQIHPRLLIAYGLMRLLPIYTAGRLRTLILRATGFRIGHGSAFLGSPRFCGDGDIYGRLVVGDHSVVNIGCFFDLNDTVSIGDHVGLGHDVLILTSTHKLGPAQRRNGALFTAPVRIEDGAWIGARSVIFPGVTVGAGAVVSAGAVVNKDVPSNALIAGTPAKVIVPRLPGS